MPVDTGPDSNLFSIPEIDLGDTFNTWRDITNLSVYKLNKLKIYDGISSSSISANVSGGGTAAFELQDNITKGVSFISPVVFSSGVTFNGAVTFNAPTFTVNANIVTIDDYNLVLGDTADASDQNISQAGGGGLQINRGSGKTASWLWNPVNIHGTTGLWLPDGNIGFTSGGAVVPYNGTTLGVHGTGILLDGGSTTEHGLLVSVSSAGGGNTSNREINFSRYSPAGATLFMQVLNGSTYTNTSGLSAGQQPFVRIPNGVNKKIVKQDHNFVVGNPVSMNSGGQYFLATADTSTNAEVVGIVSHVLSASEFEITFIGEIFGIDLTTNQDGGSLTTGAVYYLSPYHSGKVTATQPTQAGVVHKAVFIATSATSAIVYPWTGGILSEPIVLSSSAQTSVRINQLNQFKLGDIVRFKPAGSTTLTYGAGPGATSATYANGIFVRAQANSTSEAEVAGIVILREEIADTGVYRAFNLLMDGFFEFPGGVCAINGGQAGGLNAGTVYFLNINCAGTTGSFEKPSAPCYNNGHPTVAGQVRKPMLYATSSTTGYLFSYRGDVTGLPGLCANVSLSDLLIQDLGSCGGAADLNFGVKTGTGIAGGVRVMTFDGTTVGNVRIGPSSFNASSSGAGAALSVLGPILAGDGEGTNGAVIIGSRYDGPYPSTLNVFGGKYSTGNSYLSTGLRGITLIGGGYQSSTGQNLCRAAIEVGQKDIGGNRPALMFLGHSAGATGTAIGTAVQMTEYFSVAGFPSGQGARVTSGEFAAGYTNSAYPLHVSRNASGNPGIVINFAQNQYPYGVGLGSVHGNYGGDTDKGYSTTYLAAHKGYDQAAFALGFQDEANVTTGAGFTPLLMGFKHTSRIGIGITAPGASLDVNGTMRVLGGSSVNGAANTGTLLVSNATNSRQIQFGINDTSQVGWIEGWVLGYGGLTLAIQPTGGYLGIGTTGPTAVLDVNGTLRVGNFGGTTNVMAKLNNSVPTANTPSVGCVVPLHAVHGAYNTIPLPAGTWFVYLVGTENASGTDEDSTVVMAKVWTVTSSNFLRFKPSFAITNTNAGIAYSSSTSSAVDGSGAFTAIPLADSYAAGSATFSTVFGAGTHKGLAHSEGNGAIEYINGFAIRIA